MLGDKKNPKNKKAQYLDDFYRSNVLSFTYFKQGVRNCTQVVDDLRIPYSVLTWLELIVIKNNNLTTRLLRR